MAAIANRIVIGNNPENPILSFDNTAIISVNSDTSVSLIGEELYIDQFEATVDYYVWVPYVFKPTDYDGFMSSDSKVLCTRMNYDIRLLPYGTKITYYSGNNIAGIFYVKTVERVQRAWYKISAVSAIGLLDKQYHKGGLYTGQTFAEVLEEIIGNDYEYTVDGVVAIQRVHGWLPYDTKRKNLYQLLLAYGVEIVVGDNGNMFFTFPEATAPTEIPMGRIFTGGKVIYNEPASRVEIVEHSYHYVPTLDEVELFNNKNDAMVEDALVKFDQPMYPASIYCSEGSLTISTVNTNYAVVSGAGVLSGIPYLHNTRIISLDNERTLVEKVVTVQDCTVITFINSDNVLARLGEYYFNATQVEQDVVVEYEKAGRLYIAHNAFGELLTGYITRMTKNVTSIARAKCRFCQNYVPTGMGQAYSNRLVVPLGSNATYTWTIPQEVFEKENPVIRVVLIGKGQKGEDGTDGEQGGSSDPNSGKGKGGAGGLGGKGGLGGNVLIVTINADGLTQLVLRNSGIHSLLDSTLYHYSSENGAPANYGYFDILTGELFAIPGIDGTNGGNGGNGDLYKHNLAGDSTATAGEDVEYKSVLYEGGDAGTRATINGGTVGISSNLTIYVSACGGGGAAAGSDGDDARGYEGPRFWGESGDGADAVDADPPAEGHGNGGNGGNGGGAGGSGSMQEYWNHVYSSLISTGSSNNGGLGGKGSEGSEGNWGCGILYW